MDVSGSVNIRTNLNVVGIVVSSILPTGALPYIGSSTARFRANFNEVTVSTHIIPANPTSASLGITSLRFLNIWGVTITTTTLNSDNINVNLSLNPVNDTSGTIGTNLKRWGNAYIRDISVNSMDVSINLNPLYANNGSIGISNKRWGVINTVLLYVNGASVSSDDRLKHNEVIINNGLTVINQLTPKFYQKTLEMLDAHYNGDLTGYVWNYESGLIAQELLQINDISFVVSGGDYYDSNNNLIQNQYSVNYNSIFVYGLAAIKELDIKVKNQESIINSLLSRIEALENKP